MQCGNIVFVAYLSSYGSGYSVFKTSSYTLGGRSLDYASIKSSTDNSLTWSQAQGACISLGYTGLAIPDTANTAQMLFDNFFVLT